MTFVRGADPSPSFRYKIEIGGKLAVSAHFSEVNGLDFDQETFDYKEGGLNTHVHRLPGRWKFSNLNLKRGISSDGQALWNWVTSVVQGANSGKVVTHPVTITLLDVTGKKTLRTWEYKAAYPIKWAASALTADQNVIVIETLTLAHQGLSFAQ